LKEKGDSKAHQSMSGKMLGTKEIHFLFLKNSFYRKSGKTPSDKKSVKNIFKIHSKKSSI